MRTRTFRRTNLALLILAVSFAVLIVSLAASNLATVEAIRQDQNETTMLPGLEDFEFGFGQFFFVGLPAATIVALVDLFRKGSDSAGRIKNRISLALCAVAWLFLFCSVVLLSGSPQPSPTPALVPASPSPIVK